VIDFAKHGSIWLEYIFMDKACWCLSEPISAH
jgi:hypothetical protein